MVYDMVLHRWMKMVGITDNIVNNKLLTANNKLSKNRKETWRTELTACNESLGEVDIIRGIF